MFRSGELSYLFFINLFINQAVNNPNYYLFMRKFLFVYLFVFGLTAVWAGDVVSSTRNTNGHVASDNDSQRKFVLLLKAAYTNGGANEGLTADEVAAAKWFYDNYASVQDEVTGYYKGEIISASDLGVSKSINPAITKVVWVHIDHARYSSVDDATAGVVSAFGSTAVNALKQYAKAGGNIYASKYATELVASIGRVSSQYQPNVQNEVNNDDRKGVTPQIGVGADQLFDHQRNKVFQNLAGTMRDSHLCYNFLSTPTTAGTGLMWNFHSNSMTGIEDDNNPDQLVNFEIKTNSIVLGAWEHVVNYHDGGLIEFLPVVGKTSNSADDYKGRIIANGLGGYDWDNADAVASKVSGYSNIQLLTKNILDYLTTPKLRKVAYMLPRNLSDEENAQPESLGKYAVAVDQDDEKVALEWFYNTLVVDRQADVLQPKDLADIDPTEYTTMWIHIDRDAIGRPDGNSDVFGELDHANVYTMLKRYVKNGGNLLLTKHAVDMVKAGCLGRAYDAPNVFDTGMGKENNDVWAINAVIGAGYVSDQTISESYKYWKYADVVDYGQDGIWDNGTESEWPAKHGNKYVSYFWRRDNNNVAQERDADNIFDNRNNHLFYNLEVDHGHYPLTQNYGFGKIKYDVINIIGTGYKEDHNCIWTFQTGTGTPNADGIENLVLPFQDNNKCVVLGQWAHKTQLDNAAIVDFKPCNVDQIGANMPDNDNTMQWDADAWEGHILCIGLGAYEWQPSDINGNPISGENPYYRNISQLTLNALNVLDNDMSNVETKTFEVGGVTYTTWTDGGQYVATILSAADDLEVYDLTNRPDGSLVGEGKVTDPDDSSIQYEITRIGLAAFTGCYTLAYADLMDFKGIVPSDIRNRFPAWTLIYLPQEETATTLETCPIKGENIVNTLCTSGDKVCEHLKIYDNERGATASAPYVYHLFANKYEFGARKASFSRNFAMHAPGYKTTVTLPFAISADKAEKLGTFYVFDCISDRRVRFARVDALEAYKPYVFQTFGANIVNVTADEGLLTIVAYDADPEFDNVDDGNGEVKDNTYMRYILTHPNTVATYDEAVAESKGANFYGSFRPEEIEYARSKGVYAYTNGIFTSPTTGTGTIWADPFRAYLKVFSAQGIDAAKSYEMMFVDQFTPTGISDNFDTTADAKTKSFYNLQGQKVSIPGATGIYIYDNKKLLIKK